MFSAAIGVPEVFDVLGYCQNWRTYASFGADFYRLPRNQDTLTLERRAWTAPSSYPFGSDELVPMRAGESIAGTLRP
jgi:dihydroorotase